MNKIETLEMINITKSFHGVRANDNINLRVSSGEILGLLGENGAGKTTLMNILYGLYQPDAGEIRVNGRRIFIDSPKASIDHGIGMVHQHFMLVQNHTVIENIALGYAGAPVLFPQKKIRRKIVSFSENFNFNIDPDKKVWQLSAGEQQRVEIIKALINGAGLLILDEPTSVLTPQETRDFFLVLEKMRKDGQMIILISHKLDEIKTLCDRVLVLRKGQVVGHAENQQMNKRSLARMMIGRDVIFSFSRERMPRKEKVLEVAKVSVVGDKGYPMVNGISFSVFRNEIFGIAGVSGNGAEIRENVGVTAWSGASGVVYAVEAVVYTGEGYTICGGEDVNTHVVGVVGADGSVIVPFFVLSDVLDTDTTAVVGMIDVDKDGIPEVWTGALGFDGRVSAIGKIGTVLEVTHPWCGCPC